MKNHIKLFEEWSTEAPVGTDWSFLPEGMEDLLIPNFLTKRPPAGNLTVETEKELRECIRLNSQLNEEYEDLLFLEQSNSSPWKPFYKFLKDCRESIDENDIRNMWEDANHVMIIDSLKSSVKRPRPYWISDKVKVHEGCETSTYSFPSGHAAGAYYMANVLADRFPRYRAPLIDIAKRISESRIIVGVHYRSDIDAGKLIGEAFYRNKKG